MCLSWSCFISFSCHDEIACSPATVAFALQPLAEGYHRQELQLHHCMAQLISPSFIKLAWPLAVVACRLQPLQVPGQCPVTFSCLSGTAAAKLVPTVSCCVLLSSASMLAGHVSSAGHVVPCRAIPCSAPNALTIVQARTTTEHGYLESSGPEGMGPLRHVALYQSLDHARGRGAMVLHLAAEHR